MSRFLADQPSHADSAAISQSSQYQRRTESNSLQDDAKFVADPATVRLANDVSATDLETRAMRNDARAVSPAPKTLKVSEATTPVESVESSAISASTVEGLGTHSRYDPITGYWTIFAAGREERPNDFVSLPPGEDTTFDCPFCSGNEHQTPAAVLEASACQCDSFSLGKAIDFSSSCPESKPWVIRVIPNKYPAVNRPDDSHDASATGHAASHRETHPHSLFRSRAVVGAHEVFIESPEHTQSILTLDFSQVTMLLRVYQERLRHWRRNTSISYLSLFKNVGPAAGASLHHSHSQLIATSELPNAAKATADRMKLHWAKTGCCLQCDTVRAEIKARQRVVAMTDSLIAYCPYGSHLPMLLRITTRRHQDCFENLQLGELETLARLLRGSIRWMQALYPDVAYNYLIHTRPPGIVGEEMAHWSLEIFPRITQLAGFEWSSDCMINPILPEVAAASYREIAASENPMR